MDYESSLDRAMEEVPDLGGSDERLSVPDPETQKDGAFTRLTNLSAIADALSRDPEHVHSKIQQELGTAGQYEDGRARYSGNFRERDFQAAVDSYIESFVTCSECGLPDTRLETENRTPMLRCEACGAFRPVAKQNTSNTQRQEEAIESGKTYELEIVGTGRKGDGVAERGEYTVFVPGAQEGETVTAYIKNVSGNLAFARREN
ncbi:translation initiation factor IF-2 subunit beta [Halorubrum lipolyticum]|uniref:Translation initiation factor IF-2 subunit beta n=1 Tax=Halorubrum lipolyticum DSM 21995 TaxID=1227482 RepID=M0NYE5_9EURY|nr:translation initiation factor IF-2 subunit beta [Halorubrum lipolyticum]EMA62947.1 translation initiation factor IF-2 subunit beta [Halorubrum lipolyticum DSM 21995]